MSFSSAFHEQVQLVPERQLSFYVYVFAHLLDLGGVTTTTRWLLARGYGMHRRWERGGVLGGVLGGVDLESVAIFLLFVSPNNYPAGFFVEACTTVLQYSTVLNIANIGIHSDLSHKKTGKERPCPFS